MTSLAGALLTLSRFQQHIHPVPDNNLDLSHSVVLEEEGRKDTWVFTAVILKVAQFLPPYWLAPKLQIMEGV